MNIHRFLIAIIYMCISTFIALSADVTFRVVTPNSTYECWIVGNFNGWNILSSIPCKKIDNTHFTVTLNDSVWADSVDLSNIRYKYVKCPCDWSCVEKGKLGEEVSERAYRADVNDTIFSWVDFPMAYLIPIKVKTPPQTEECYLIGSFNDWKMSDDLWKMDKYNVEESDSVVFITNFVVNMCANNETKYQFCCGPSIEYVQAEPADTFALSQTIFPTVKAWKKNYKTAIYNPLPNQICVFSKKQKICIAGIRGDEEIVIFDVIGKMSRSIFAKGKTEIEIPVESGIYTIKLAGGVKKILVE